MVGGLRLTVDSLQLTARDSEVSGEKLGAELFRLGSARGSGQGFRWGAGAVVIWAMGIGMGPSLCSGATLHGSSGRAFRGAGTEKVRARRATTVTLKA